MSKINVNFINVPEYVEHISDWKEFVYPQGHLILDKTICGCGFTDYCLSNHIPTILCSPRKVLLENKIKQHNCSNIYYFKNEDIEENFDSEDVNTLDVDNNSEQIPYIVSLKEDLINWLDSLDSSVPPKILVTYDSLHHVLNALGEQRFNYYNFAIVIDEFQSIFLDAAFKATVELEFLDILKSCPNVLYLSATPALEDDLEEVDEFNSLPFYKLIWPDSRVENVRIKRVITKSINKDLSEYIKNYRNSGNLVPVKILRDGTVVRSHELVIFVNSVKTIIDVIKKNKLLPSETNIICSRTEKNIKKLKKVGHVIGEPPSRGEPHKMFTLCTRTSYLGADFYSTSAYTIICSDCTIQTLIIDISLDLPQIIGRQRLKENLFRSEVLFLYKSGTIKESMLNLPEKEFHDYMTNKDLNTKKLLEGYSKMSPEEKKSCAEKWSRDKALYETDFVGISSKTGEAKYNKLVKAANQRAYRVSRKDYQDMVTIKREMEKQGYEVVEGQLDSMDDILNEFEISFNSSNQFCQKMKILCSYYKQYPELFVRYEKLMNAIVPLNYQNYLNLLGPSVIGSLDYVETRLKDYMQSKLSEGDIKDDIIASFVIGNRYSKSEIKNILKKIYDTNGILKTPKATDIEQYYNIKLVNVFNPETGKKDKGFKLISVKD